MITLPGHWPSRPSTRGTATSTSAASPPRIGEFVCIQERRAGPYREGSTRAIRHHRDSSFDVQHAADHGHRDPRRTWAE